MLERITFPTALYSVLLFFSRGFCSLSFLLFWDMAIALLFLRFFFLFVFPFCLAACASCGAAGIPSGRRRWLIYSGYLLVREPFLQAIYVQ
ncbi:hypothetical protein J3F83DRAFT_338530 [Trichoderma novae-zelandiae]